MEKRKTTPIWGRFFLFGGSGEIRTHGGLASSSVFKTDPFNRSGTLPKLVNHNGGEL